MKFSDMAIKNLKPASKVVYIREGNGFAVKVWPSGVKTWCFIFTLDGKRREMKLGEYPSMTVADARVEHGKAYNLVQKGINPADVEREQKIERRLAPTVKELVKDYIEKYSMVKKKSWKEDKRCLEKEVVPLWGMRKAKDIRKRDVVLLLEEIVDRGSPVMANNTFEKIRKMFNYAVEKDILEFSPCFGIKAPTKREHKDRVLSNKEIATLWRGLNNAAMNDDIRRALKLVLVTGQRPGEVIGMHSGEIDGDWWAIPAERAKNGKVHRVYLTELAKGLIGAKKGFVFPSPVSGRLLPDGTKRQEQPIDENAVALAVRRSLNWPLVDERGNPLYTKDGKQATVNKIGVDGWTPHDLRRTAATNLAALGYGNEVIDAVLNHVARGVVAIYNRHRYDAEKQTALSAWSRALEVMTGVI